MDSQHEPAMGSVVAAAQAAYASAYVNGQDEAIRAAVAATLRAAVDIARWCQTCGQPHQQRPAIGHTTAGRPFEYQSWADPGDGHGYRRHSPDQVIDAITRIVAELEGVYSG